MKSRRLKSQNYHSPSFILFLPPPHSPVFFSSHDSSNLSSHQPNNNNNNNNNNNLTTTKLYNPQSNMSRSCPPHPLPLTTPFPVPASCTATLHLTTYNATTTLTTSPPPGARFSSTILVPSVYPTTDLSAYGLVAGLATAPASPPPPGGGAGRDPACYPERYAELRAAAAWSLDRGDKENNDAGCGRLPAFYSPGVCPSSWSRVNEVVVEPAGAEEEEEEEEEEEAETRATCCPAGFTVPPADAAAAGANYYCESVVSAETSAYDAGAGGWTGVTAGTVRAAGVEVRWRAGDVAGLYGGGMAGGGGGGGGALSAGAKAGIGLGIGLGGMGLGVGLVGLWLRRRTGRRGGMTRWVPGGWSRRR